MIDIHDTRAKHYIADFYQVDPDLLDNIDFCMATVEGAIEAAGCDVLNSFQHKFHPQGVSINLTLSESHCAIHTWPERGYCAIDLYACGDADLDKGIAYFVDSFKPKKKVIKIIDRGCHYED